MMRFPDSSTSYLNSVIARFPIILDLLEIGDMKPQDLLEKLISAKPFLTNNKAHIICSYWNTLDCLFYLGKIGFDKERGVLCYVDRNKVR